MLLWVQVPRWLFGVGIVLAAYFTAATWSVLTYVDPAPKPGAIQLFRPFAWRYGLAWSVGEQPTVNAAALAGEFTIWQDDHPLERRTQFRDLQVRPGRFTHDGPRILFSARGNPNSDGHRYWAVKP
jgi:hypothetical protein